MTVGYRWTIVALLFAATTINYIDRQVLGVLAPTLQRELHWSETDYGVIVSWFSLAYGFGLLGMGRVMDWIGARKGFSLAVVAWSVAAMAHALTRTVTGFAVARALLGLGESGNFPGAVKTVAAWFPKRERALATGIFNAGTNVGAVLAPLIVPWIALTWGWPWAFLVTGAMGFLWLGAWLTWYREPEHHPKLSAAELAHIREGPADPDGARRLAWPRLLRHRQTWAFVVGKALTDPVWLFYLFWLPKFLDANWGVRLAGLAAPLVVIYVVADVGSVAGGWLSSALIARGWSVNRGRKTAMLVAALLIVPTMFAPAARSMWMAVAIVSVAAAAHQWWSANLFTTVSDMFPRQAVGSVIGIGGFGGAMAAMLFQRATGYLLDATGGNYTPIFAACGLAYVTALLLIHGLAPRLVPAA
ncbi:MAG TPA: MFS transporter [Gemmatimonadales bacterium]|nr:MFS transporter [Gemmatimonadales bacterium]